MKLKYIRRRKHPLYAVIIRNCLLYFKTSLSTIGLCTFTCSKTFNYFSNDKGTLHLVLVSKRPVVHVCSNIYKNYKYRNLEWKTIFILNYK